MKIGGYHSFAISRINNQTVDRENGHFDYIERVRLVEYIIQI